MQAKDYFFRMSYQQYQQNKEEEREKWEIEVLQSILKIVKEEDGIDTPLLDKAIEEAKEREWAHSNNFGIEKTVNGILRREKNQDVANILKSCWIASWDFPDEKNARVETEPCYDGSYLVRINTELIVNLTRVIWLYTTILLLEDITPYADIRDGVALNTLKSKFIKDVKNDTDKGTEFLMECLMTDNTKYKAYLFVQKYYESALTFIIMHEVGHILELNDNISRNMGLHTSKSYKDLTREERKRRAEWNADIIGNRYSDEYINIDTFFNMGPVLVILTLAINHKSIIQETDHPSLKNRYENALCELFKKKETGEILHTRKLLYKICQALQDEKCWSIQDNDWWKNEIGLI